MGFGWRHIAQAFMVTLVDVRLDESFVLDLKLAGWKEFSQQKAVNQVLVPTLEACAGGIGITCRSTSRRGSTVHPNTCFAQKFPNGLSAQSVHVGCTNSSQSH